MVNTSKHILLLVFVILSLIPAVFAHTPLNPGGENNSLEAALDLSNPTKSWTLYRELHEEGAAEYFRLHLREGEQFVVSVYMPRNAEGDFVPNLIVMGPSIEQHTSAPSAIEVPADAEVTLIEGIRPEAPEYEPFTPASYYFTADYRANVTVEGDYYFIVYSDEGEGRYGVAVGYVETFTLIEWLRIPIDVIAIHQWEGQSLPFILLPMALTVGLGLILLFWNFQSLLESLPLFLGALAGLLYLGSGVMLGTQMVIAIIGATSTGALLLTLIFLIMPIVLGFAILRKMIRSSSPWTTRDYIILAVFGILGLFLWAGLLVGPVVAIIASISPR